MIARPGVAALLRGACPRCGEACLYRSAHWLGVRFAPRCRACGLDYEALNVGDGPAAFLILIVGAIVTGLALWTELALEPRWWMHLVWLPLTLVLTLGGLRLAKAWLASAEYRNDAREGRRIDR